MEKINDDISEFINDFSAFTPIDSIYKVDKEENKDLKEDNKAWKKLEQEDKKTDIRLKWLYGVFIVLVLGFWEWFVIRFSFKQLNPCDKCVHKISDPVLSLIHI